MGLLRLILLNVWFYPFYLIVSAVMIPIIAVVVLSTELLQSRRRAMWILRRSMSFYGNVVSRLPFPFIRLRYDRNVKLDPKKTYIFVSNHRSMIDAFLFCVLPVEAIQVISVWPFKIPVLGTFARMAGYLSIRTLSPEEFFERAKALLDEGVSLIFFPEGTRSSGREIGNFQGAAFRLFLQSGVPIVPICMSGSEKVSPRGSLFLRGGQITVRTLPQVKWDEHKDKKPFTLKNQVRAAMAKELAIMDGVA